MMEKPNTDKIISVTDQESTWKTHLHKGIKIKIKIFGKLKTA
jgi:hypothetical protein